MSEFWSGALTLLGVEAVLLVLGFLFLPRVWNAVEEFFAWYGCDVCGAHYAELSKPARILPHLWHSIVTLDKRHRIALAVWRIENGRDPVNGRRMPMEGVWSSEFDHYGD